LLIGGRGVRGGGDGQTFIWSKAYIEESEDTSLQSWGIEKGSKLLQSWLITRMKLCEYRERLND